MNLAMITFMTESTHYRFKINSDSCIYFNDGSFNSLFPSLFTVIHSAVTFCFLRHFCKIDSATWSSLAWSEPDKVNIFHFSSSVFIFGNFQGNANANIPHFPHPELEIPVYHPINTFSSFSRHRSFFA